MTPYDVVIVSAGALLCLGSIWALPEEIARGEIRQARYSLLTIILSLISIYLHTP